MCGTKDLGDLHNGSFVYYSQCLSVVEGLHLENKDKIIPFVIGLKSRKVFATPVMLEEILEAMEEFFTSFNCCLFSGERRALNLWMSNKSGVGIIGEFGSVHVGIRDLALTISDISREQEVSIMGEAT